MCSIGADIVLEYNMNPAWALNRPARYDAKIHDAKIKTTVLCDVHFKLVDHQDVHHLMILKT